MQHEDIQEFKNNLSRLFPLGIPRKKIGEATGGILNPRTMSNRDSAGEGIKGRFKIGGTIVYPVAGVVDFISLQIREA